MRYLFLLFINAIILQSVSAQNTVIQSLINNNQRYSSDITYIIHSDEEQVTLEGGVVVDTSFTYLRLKNTEFFNFDGFSIKVANDERKMAYGVSSGSGIENLISNPDGMSNIYFEPDREIEKNGGRRYVCYPIESMKPYLGTMTIYTDDRDRILRIVQEQPLNHPYGIESIEIHFLNRTSIIDFSKDPRIFFKITDDKLLPIKKYTNYQIL